MEKGYHDLRVGDFNVSIYAEYAWSNEEATITFLNKLSLMIDEGADMNEQEGYKEIANEYREYAKDLFEYAKNANAGNS